jgi:hypothetical protein
MQQLKDIVARMDGIHPLTARRWWKKLDRECAAAGRPRVKPDVRGHGPDRWEDATAERFIALWKQYFDTRGTTPQIFRNKFQGNNPDKNQLDLLTWKSPLSLIQNSNPCPPAASARKSGKKPAPNKKPSGQNNGKPKAPAN